MAINVNTVYTTVLSILNKEQRGYLTPYEFNQLATQVQLEIFEKFFEDYNQYIRMPKTDVEFASRMDHISEEFQVFEKYDKASASSLVDGFGVYTQPIDLHRFGTVNYKKGLNSPEIEIVSNRDYTQQTLSPLTQPSTNFPIAKYFQNKITVAPQISAVNDKDVVFNYIRKPKDPRWGYTTGSLGQFIYDSNIYNSNMLLIGSVFSPNVYPVGTTAIVGTYNNVATTTSGSGTGALVTIVVSGASVGDTVVVTNSNVSFTIQTGSNSGYVVGDTLTIAAADFGGNNPITTNAVTASQLASSGTTQGSIDFEISDAQQTEVIIEILKYAGVIIRDPQIVQSASQLSAANEANTKR